MCSGRPVREAADAQISVLAARRPFRGRAHHQREPGRFLPRAKSSRGAMPPHVVVMLLLRDRTQAALSGSVGQLKPGVPGPAYAVSIVWCRVNGGGIPMD